jgi:hypothetical protein
MKNLAIVYHVFSNNSLALGPKVGTIAVVVTLVFLSMARAPK